jgi:hypothetical protein
MAWMGAIPVTCDFDTPEETIEHLRAFADDITVAADAHGFDVIPEPQDAETALQVCNALQAALEAARATYATLTRQESQWN